MVEPEANNTNLSATNRFSVFWKDAVPNTVKLLFSITFGWIVKSPEVVLIVLSFVTPTVILPAVTPANDGLSVVCNPKSIVEPATPFVVSKASPCVGEDNTDAETIPAGIPVIPE